MSIILKNLMTVTKLLFLLNATNDNSKSHSVMLENYVIIFKKIRKIYNCYNYLANPIALMR